MIYRRFAHRFTSQLLFLLICLMAANVVAQQTPSNQEHLHIEPTPDWVIEREPLLAEFIPVDEIRNGVFYQLLDDQVRVEEDGFRTTYTRYIETVVNQTGVEESSQINLDFDPSYQKLSLNSLTVIRDGTAIDRLDKAAMSIFSRETELNQQIYSGRLTLNILLDDIQAGDTIDYSYTIHGQNPVYKNIFSFLQGVNWSVPLYNQHLRVLWGKSAPLKVESRNINPEIVISKVGEFTEYQISLQNQEALNTPSQIPDWYSPYGSVHFNETLSWSDVVAWAEPLYRFDTAHPDIQEIANAIKAASSSQSEQIVAALKYTQENIRYVGLEMGQNSHLPTAPEQTLALKYGDCKDKAVVFIALLRALQIDAYPALVDTESTKLLAEMPPGINLFNHVIVTLEIAGEQYWLDPTLSNQLGDLANIYQPDYGYALVLKEGNKQLSAVQKDASKTQLYTTEKYVIPENDDSPVMFSVTTQYKGYGALRRLWQLEQKGKNQMAEDYEVYYQRTHPSLTTVEEMTIEADESSGELTIEESYIIDKFWTLEKKNLEVDFYPTNIRNAVFKPKQSQRNGPLAFTYPNNIRNTVEVTFKQDDWDFDAEAFDEDNDFFSYSSSVAFENNVLTINYFYSAKTDHIPQDRIDEYIEARTRLRKDAYYGLIKYIKDDDAESTKSSKAEKIIAEDDKKVEEYDSEFVFWLWLLVAIYGFGLLYIIVDWQLESRKRPEFTDTHFYPIAPWKFWFLSIVSIGIYDAYWMYRNWKAIKIKTNEEMMPIARGIFVIFWIYPLFLSLRQDSEDRFQTNKVLASWLAGLIAIMYFIFYLSGSFIDDITYWVLFLSSPLLFFPFINYINNCNKIDPAALIFNTKWRFRQVLTAILFTPILLMIIVSETPLLPSDSVIKQSQIMQHDLRYFYRQRLIPANEKIHYFYSDAYFDVRDDGNGFTDKRVFSYWQDDDDGFQKEVVTFDAIANIEVQFSDDEYENTIITITRNDETDFMLFVSTIDEGDQLFVKELKKRWKKKRN